MRKSYEAILARFAGRFSAWILALAFLLCAAATARAQLPPVNDNLTNATGITGSTGTILGTNLHAAIQSGEATPYGGGASIWYLWTAPYTTTIDFNTRGSTDPLTGLPLDTILAFYQLKGTNLNITNLTLLATNDDDPSGGVVSRLDVPVTVGTVYAVQVLGSTNNPTGTNAVAEGVIQLNWGPSLVAGNFGFSSKAYFCSTCDDFILNDYGGNTIAPSLFNQAGKPNVRVTVSRQGQATGKCEVNFLVTNVLMTNFFETNYTGTNIYITNFTTNGQFVSYTNSFLTNVLSQNLFEQYINEFGLGIPDLVAFPFFNAYQVTQTNYTGGLPLPPATNSLDLSKLGLTNFFTNFPCLNISNMTVTTNGNFITVAVTQLFCYDVFTNYITLSASNGVDYTAINTNLIFNDFQMSQDFYVGVNPQNLEEDGYLGFGTDGPDWPDVNGNFTFYGANAFVSMTLSNVVLDPLEDKDIVPPTISSTASNADLVILNMNANPFNYIGSPVYINTNVTPGTFCTLNFERATFRVNKTSHAAYLYAVMSGPEVDGTSYTFHYTIDSASASPFPGTPINAFNWNGFPLVADSDYAQPSFNGVLDGADFGIPVGPTNDPSGHLIGGQTLFPSGKPYIGSFTITYNGPQLGEICIPIFTNGAVEFDMDMYVQIFETVADAQANSQSSATHPPCYLGNVTEVPLTINFSGAEPGGAYDASWNVDGSLSSQQPNDVEVGANGGPVQAVGFQSTGQAIIGGYFSSYNTIQVYGLARLLSDGFLDTSFNPITDGGVNYGGYVNALAVDSTDRIIIGGNFTSYDGTNSVNIARINAQGSFDSTFNTGIGFNVSDVVYCMALDANSNILVGGKLTSYNATNVNNLIRLTPSGGLDTNFTLNFGLGAANFGPNKTVRAVATDSSGNIIIGGMFTSVTGSNLNYLARLLPNGTVDPSFNPEIGPDSTVYSIAVEPNNEIVIGGAFQHYNLVSRPGVALVSTGGALDPSFVPGTGADGVVYSVVLQPSTGDIVVGGQFRTFNTSRRLGIAWLLPQGWIDSEFMDTAFNQYAGLINKAYNDPINAAYALGVEPTTGNIIMGGSFTNVGGGTARDQIHTQFNVTRLIGAPNPGPQTGGGGIGNCPGNITLTQNTYTVDDTASKKFVVIDRVNGSLALAKLTLGTNQLPPGSGSATPSDFGLILPDAAEYGSVWSNWIVLPAGNYSWRICDGYYGNNNNIQPISDPANLSYLNLSIYDDKTALQNLFASISELNINSQDLLVLGGVPIPLYPALGLPTAQLEIVNDNFPPGILGFTQTNYVAVDTSNTVTLTVVRTNGSFGPVSVEYYTGNGTAYTGINYTGVNAGPNTILNFAGGADNTATFTIPITQQSTVVSNTYFNVYLTDPSYSGAFDTNVPPIVPSNTVVTIIDGNFAPGHLSFTSPTYSVLKGGEGVIGVQRTGGALGVLSVQVVTADGTGSNGLNYVGITNTLTWQNQDVSIKTNFVQALQDNTVEGPKTVNLSLVNATNVGNVSSNNLIISQPSAAVLTILDVDSYGGLTFASPNFTVSQEAEQALITVIRTNGTTGTLSVNYATFNDSNAILPYVPAQAGTNYSATSGTLTFLPGQTSTNFYVPIIYTPAESNTANRLVTLELFNGSPAAISNEFPVFATLTILDPQLVLNSPGSVDRTTLNGTGFNNEVNSLALQPDGSILAGGQFTFFNQYPFDYVARLQPSGAYDNGFLFDQAGANAPVLQVLSQPATSNQINGPIVIAGSFTQVDQVARNGVARLNLDGSLDETFYPGSGADGAIFALADTYLPSPVTNEPPVLAYYVGGSFANFDGVPSGGITRLNASTNSPGYQGTPDPNFNSGLGVTGTNATVHAVAVQANGQIILGGDFTSFNGTTYNHLVRLNVDGSVDTTFTPSTDSDLTGSVRAITIQPNGQILIGGLFTNVNGSNYNYLARLNSDGTTDTNFNVGVGGNNSVLTLALDDQQRILVGGEFTRFSGVTRSGITRLNPDGTVDPTINFGSGAEGGLVDTIVIQTNSEIDVGGGFSIFEGISENNFVRLYGGAIYGDGRLQFSLASYGVLENATNAVITIERLGGEGTSTQPTVTVLFSTSDGTATNGVDYVGVTNTLTFPLGETFQTVTIPILDNPLVGSNRYVFLSLSDPTYATLGGQPTAFLIITNVNTDVAFSAASYRQDEDAPGGSAIIPIVRQGNPDTTVSVTVYTGTNGSATPYTNYMPTTSTIVFTNGVMTNYFLVPVLNQSNMYSDLTVDLEMSNAMNTFIGSPGSATLTIASVYDGPGVLSFAQSNYTVIAPTTGTTNAAITIIRTNGLSSNVWVTLTTSNGTAIAGVNYSSVQTVVNFADGQSTQTIYIPIDAEPSASPPATVILTLSNPNGTTISGPSQAILTIQNDIENFSFAGSPYFITEGTPVANLSIVRQGPATNTATVFYSTYTPPNVNESEGYAVPNVDYVPASNTVTFTPNETSTTIPITILQGTNVNGPLTFQVVLSDPTPSGVEIGIPGTASVTILSDVTGFEFSTNAYFVAEDGTNVIITVDRLDPNTGAASVQFGTSNGTNQNPLLNASNQVDYVATSGTLNFLNGEASASFIIPIINANQVENNKNFNVSLSDPLITQGNGSYTNAFLEYPSNAVVTITNVLAGVSFSSSTYNFSECDLSASIPVVISGVTNNTVTVTYSTANGSAIAGNNYTATSGTLTFTNGQTAQDIVVPLNNNHIIGPNLTFFITLSNAAGAQLLSPSVAVVTLDQCNGAYVVSSGTAFVSGSVSNNDGVIFPNETVTILFGLRDIAGGNTSDLVATLATSNSIGITNITQGTNTYGALVQGGPTVSRPYTFEAVGTNGENITATLSLTDGTNVYPNVAFGFTLGGGTFTFSTNEVLLLNGSSGSPPTKAYNNNPPNYGYPSEINVQGIVGNITGVTATISNYGHSYPDDVEVVLEGPTLLDTCLMADAGGSKQVNHLNLTFSPTASNNVPVSTVASGTYKPTDYYPFNEPLPTNGIGMPRAPLTPFPTNLNTFVGTSPNGTWYLWVADDESLDLGYISNGWSITITTGIPVENDSDLGLTLVPSTATPTLGNPMTYNISVTNYGPSGATNVIITDTIPPGVLYGTNLVGTNGLIVTNVVASLLAGSGVTLQVQITPESLGYLTNIAVAVANEPDPNTNNVQTNVELVSVPSADLGVSFASGSPSPNPVLDGSPVTYVIVVTNNGPSTATGVTTIDTLPNGFLANTNLTSTSTGTYTNVNGTVTWSVGTLNANATATMTLVAGVNLPEQSLPTTSLDSVIVSSAVYDPVKFNNFAAVKSEVEPAMISVAPSGANFILSWPVTPGNTYLQGSASLPPTWVTLDASSITSQSSNGKMYNTFTLPGTNGYHYFRLMSQVP